jgi:hypothetical protein
MENEALELQSSDFEEDRYARLRLIPWWDQERLKNATIMVVGAGAIGNELIKNLTLLGIGRILVYDMDAIESTNLTRSVLYRSLHVSISLFSICFFYFLLQFANIRKCFDFSMNYLTDSVSKHCLDFTGLHIPKKG